MSQSEADLKATPREKINAILRRKPGAEPVDDFPRQFVEDEVSRT